MVQDPRKLQFCLQSIDSSEFNDVVQIDPVQIDVVQIFMITEVHQEGRFYRLSTHRSAHYENIKPPIPTTEDWCIPADME